MKKFINNIGIHGVIFDQDDKILLLKRSEIDKYDPLTWDIPGGGIEKRESIEEGFVREIREEAGININYVEVVGAYTIDDDSLQLLAQAHLKEGTVILRTEHSGFKWVSSSIFLDKKPVSIHLKAAQYMYKNKVRVVKYKEYI